MSRWIFTLLLLTFLNQWLIGCPLATLDSNKDDSSIVDFAAQEIVPNGESLVGTIEKANQEIHGGSECRCEDRRPPGERLVEAAQRMMEQCGSSIRYGYHPSGRIGRPFIQEDSVRLRRQIDCSGALSALSAMTGLPFFSERTNYVEQFLVTTRSFRHSDCMDSVDLDVRAPYNGLKKGDFINHPGNPGHVVMIQEMGEDPFGFNNPAQGSCAALNPELFDIQVFESARGLDGPGVRSVHETRGSLRNALVRLASQVCRQREGQPVVNAGSTIKRHQGSRIPGCEMGQTKDLEC